MGFARMPGGGRFLNDDTRFLAIILLGIFLAVFFLLVIRIEWDKRHGQKTPPLQPTRNPASVIRSVLGG